MALPLVIVGDLLDAAVVVVGVPGQEPRVLLVGDQQAGGGTIGFILGGAICSALLIPYGESFLKDKEDPPQKYGCSRSGKCYIYLKVLHLWRAGLMNYNSTAGAVFYLIHATCK